jgi:hypothetical protein
MPDDLIVRLFTLASAAEIRKLRWRIEGLEMRCARTSPSLEYGEHG